MVVEKQDYTVTSDSHIKDGQAEGGHLSNRRPKGDQAEGDPLYGITEEIEN